MKRRGDYLVIGLTLLGLAALLIAYLLEPLRGQGLGHFQPGAAGAPRHGLAAILFVVLILLLVENIVEERRAEDDCRPYDRRRWLR